MPALAVGTAFGDDVLATDLADWLRTNGARIHDGLSIRRRDPADPTSPRGVFATRAIDEGEVLCNIPWELLIKPENKYDSDDEDDDDDGGLCDTLVSTIEAEQRLNGVGGRVTLHQKEL